MIELNAAQRAAVERWDQDVCVVAGPGSGKTRVLIERFRWLIEARHVPAHRILAVTFTEKAAAEIKRRLLTTFAGDNEKLAEIERAWVSTIHGFCTRLLKENALAAGIVPDFRLLDEAGAWAAQHACALKAWDDALARTPEMIHALIGTLDVGSAGLIQGLIDVYEELRKAGRNPVDLKVPQAITGGHVELERQARLILADGVCGSATHQQFQRDMKGWAARALKGSIAPLPETNARTDSPTRRAYKALKDDILPQISAENALAGKLHLYPSVVDVITRFDTHYRALKRNRGVLDFNDLEERAIALIESDEALRTRIAGSFDQILMDEVQDTNPLQWRLISLLRRPDRLFAVGDINQSIYGFRHASPGLFRNYRDELRKKGATIDELRENYRSRPQLLNIVNRIVPGLEKGVEPHRLIARRDPGDSVLRVEHCNVARDVDDAAAVEARWIAGRIAALAPDAGLGNIAVLTRTVGAMEPIRQALDDAGIPSLISGGRGFHESREIRDLTAWLAILSNPLDEISMLTVLRSPLVGLSDAAIAIWKLGGKMAPEDAAKWEWFQALLASQRTRRDYDSPGLLIEELLDESGYELSPRAMANVSKLIAMLSDSPDWRTTGELVDELYWRRLAEESEAPGEDAVDAVRLMTVHAAKGLEFKVVFVASLRTKGNESKPVFAIDEAGTLGMAWRVDPDTVVSDPVHRAVYNHQKLRDEGEEERLLYVAMTRAEEHLLFSANMRGKGLGPGVCETVSKPSTSLMRRVSVLKTHAREPHNHRHSRDARSRTARTLKSPSLQ